MKAELKKTLMKIGLIIMLVFSIIWCCTIVGIVFGILGIVAYKKLRPIVDLPIDEFTQKIDAKEKFAWSIVSLVLVGLVGLLIFLPYVIKTDKQ